MNVLVTGGAGYIGSHTVLALVKAGHRPVIVDNFSNSSRGVVRKLRELTGEEIICHEADCGDPDALQTILRATPCEGLIHFAAFKAVGESTERPLRYYRNNVSNFISVLETAIKSGVRHVVFSSTAAVYGTPRDASVDESTPAAPESPYGWSKRMDEVILRDACAATPGLHGAALRYFNVVGSDPSATIGESSGTTPQNLLPIIVEVMAGKRSELVVNGSDYPTKDGTCVRDYVHVSDLAEAHVAALRHASGQDKAGYDMFNISTGTPTSVQELISAFERVNDVKVPRRMGPRRPGDPAAYYATADKARTILGWTASRTIEDACRDAWRWQTEHPDGYDT